MSIKEEVYLESGFKDKSEKGSKSWLVQKNALKTSILSLIDLTIRKTKEQILNEIEKFDFAKRFKDCKYFGFDNKKINEFIKEQLKKSQKRSIPKNEKSI